MDDSAIAGIVMSIIGLITAITAYIKARTANKKIDEVKNGK